MDPPRKVAFYIRVSTERQARVEEGSLKNQEQMLRTELERRNAQRPGWGAFVESYVDEGISAKTTNRPAFQRLMRDIELGKIDTVLFTELSRLSRSLKDFLNIFEFAQRHACDLVCLKTEIDTTSPYQGLVTKILMVFSEFEREMTSRRTALNAYERSKRGLANGGFTVLGYRRDAQHKGRLLVDEQEAEVVRAIFQTYVQERSIRRTTEQIKARYQGRFPKLEGICPNTVYRVLLNKAYLGIRAIHKRDKANYEEVGAAWEPSVEEPLFGQVQALLQANKHRYHRRGPELYTYLLSGLIRCGSLRREASRHQLLRLQRQAPPLLLPPHHLLQGRAPSHPCRGGPGPGAGLAAGHRRQWRALPGAAGPGAGAARPAARRATGLLEGVGIGRGCAEKAGGGADSGADPDQGRGRAGLHREEHYRPGTAAEGDRGEAAVCRPCCPRAGVHRAERRQSVHRL
jgi:DNA invertase Pin-like site-specific DNA recombinase